MREMKAMIEREVQRRNIEDDIKLGAGGIREVEFIVQVFQLIYGGAKLELQDRQCLVNLNHLDDAELLDEAGGAGSGRCLLIPASGRARDSGTE